MEDSEHEGAFGCTAGAAGTCRVAREGKGSDHGRVRVCQ